MIDYAKSGKTIRGSKLPWTKIHSSIGLSSGKLSIWAGASGSGKSLLLGQVVTKLMIEGQRAVIASLEMKPAETITRMITQSATCSPSSDYVSKWIDKFDDKLWIYDELDRVGVERILGMAHYSAHELGIKHIIIDSLTKCGVGRDDYTKQAEFVDRLQWCAKTWDIHIHLVCHMRKSDSRGKNDIRGAAEITDLADNVFILTRNHTKEEEALKQAHGKSFNEKILTQADAYLKIAKNRENGFEPNFSLWFHQNSGNYLGSDSKYVAPLEL